MTNAQTEARAIARRLWKEHGGEQFGPHTETLSMPLDRFGGFVDALITSALAAKDAELAKANKQALENGMELCRQRTRAERAEAALAEANRKIAEKDKALEAIKAHVTGDRYPNWYSSSDVTSNRMWIADTCDAARRAREQVGE